jgi:hypothetical protein
MALLFPIMIALVFNFIGMMLQVVIVGQLQSGVNLAASSAIQADLGDVTVAQGLAQTALNGTFQVLPGTFGKLLDPTSKPALVCQPLASTQPVKCTATIDETSELPFLFWVPGSVSVSAEAYPPPVRYCGVGAC